MKLTLLNGYDMCQSEHVNSLYGPQDELYMMKRNFRKTYIVLLLWDTIVKKCTVFINIPALFLKATRYSLLKSFFQPTELAATRKV